MFDSVGRTLDEDAGKRQATSVGILLLLASLISCVGLLGGLFAAKQAGIELPIIDEVLTDITIEDALPDMPPPPPPPPPPPAAADASEEDEDDETKTTPDDVTEVEELKDQIKDEMKSDSKPKGVVGGVEGGVEGGVVGGVQGGVVGGVLGGVLGGGGPKVVHHSSVEWKRQPSPVYPSAAKGMNLGEQACKTTMRLDDKGVPTSVQVVSGCPQVFHQAVEEGLYQWRAYPVKDAGKPIPVALTVMVKFVER